ncbi:MAG: hypothetical protein WCV67_14015 [Victivallaceae bacterium]|jgi:hypothetical protein
MAISKPYFPMLLANGVDSMLIDWSGSIRACDKGLEHVDRCWFKADRRKGDGDSALCPLLFTGYMLTLDGEQHLIRDFEQRFDPCRAVLHTSAEAAGFKFKVTTFLTVDHLLVEHFEFIAVPAGDAAVEFVLSRPEGDEPEVEYEFARDDYSGMTARYASSAWSGIAMLLTDPPATAGQIGAEGGRLAWRGGRISVRNIRPKMQFTQYLFVGDTLDYDEPARAAETIRNKITSMNYAGILREHATAWNSYQRRSSIRTGNPDIDYLYTVSNYLLKAHQHPVDGSTPTGMYPWLWQGKIFWDSFFMHEAFLRNNKMAEAEKLSLFNLKILPQARRNAELWKQKYGRGDGARYGWCTDRQGRCNHLLEIDEFHNNAVVAVAAFNQFRFTGDHAQLQTLFPVIRDAVDFIVSYGIREDTDSAVIVNCEGVDESTRCRRGNDTWTAGATIKALGCLIESAQILNVGISPQYERILRKMELGLKANHDPAGLLLAAQGANSSSFGSMIFLLNPEYESARRTMTGLWRNRGRFVDVCRCGCPRQDARNVPWFQAWAAAIWASLGDPRKASAYLDACCKNTNRLGGLPEQVRPDGSLYKHWMATAHASFLTALSRMAVNVYADTVQIGAGIPDSWPDCSVRNLRVEQGLSISYSLKNSVLRHLRIVNSGSKALTFKLSFGRNVKLEASFRKHCPKDTLFLLPGKFLRYDFSE